MKKFPEILPDVVITRKQEKLFTTRAMQGFDAKFGEKAYSAEYDTRQDIFKRKTIENASYIKGKACIHGVMCLEVKETVGLWDSKPHELTEFVVVSDTHIKTIAAMEECNGVNGLLTFLDDDFYKHWGAGENNCGFEIELKQKGIITCDKDGRLYVEVEKPGISDIVGRYKVVIGERAFDTIRMVFTADDGQVSDFYYDAKGEEVLRRFFVPDRWGYDDKINRLYSERWPHVESLFLNGERRVCTTYIIPDYVL